VFATANRGRTEACLNGVVMVAPPDALPPLIQHQHEQCRVSVCRPTLLESSGPAQTADWVDETRCGRIRGSVPGERRKQLLVSDHPDQSLIGVRHRPDFETLDSLEIPWITGKDRDILGKS
jgi:hypothetical protein